MSDTKKQKLELTWIGKDDEFKLEPRILIEDPDKSFGDKNTENMLIHGDNLLALKALEQDYAGKIKCIYIDPPYNTGNAFEHYDDNLEHSLWLSLMKPRLELLKTLLSDDGVIFVQIDDNEMAYLKVIMDDIFERNNFNSMITVKVASESGVKVGANKPVRVKENILVYSKTKNYVYKRQFVPDERYSINYSYFVEDIEQEPSKWSILNVKDAYKKIKNEKHKSDTDLYKFQLEYKNNIFSVRDISDNLKKEFGDNPNQFIIKEKENKKTILWKKGEVVFFSNKVNMVDGKECATKYLSDIWTDIKWDGIANEGNVSFKQSKKPERLVQRILSMASNKGDLVLDSFLGSGTTAAVAHKMGRKYIGIELGEHAYSHCVSRLKSVINGNDQGGISKAVEWKGGGGYKFYELAPSLLKKDKFGNFIIEEKYNAHMLAAALAKQEGFHFQPNESVFWKQAKSTEKDFLFVTTQFFTIEMLDKIHDEMQPEESLLIVCKAYYEDCIEKYPNISIKKIPQVLLGRCEFGKDDYSLNIINSVEDEVWKDVEQEEVVKEKVKKTS